MRSAVVLDVSDATGYAKHRSRPRRAVIRVYDQAGNVIKRVSKQTILGSGEFCRKQSGSVDNSIPSMIAV